MKYLVTGAAGFIGFHVARRLCGDGHQVVGIDNLNDYYAVSLKEARLALLTPLPGFRFEHLDLADRAAMASLFAHEQFDRVIHLGAQAGVRYSLDNPFAYADSNLTGHLTVLEGCRQTRVQHLVYASSSSVYGLNEQMPFKPSDGADHPVSLYAASKKAGELMTHSYSHLYGLPTTGLRFFTVYGPWGRPDMALFKFVRAILNGDPIDLYNQGQLSRDFTHVDDIVEGIVRISDSPPRAMPTGRGPRTPARPPIASSTSATAARSGCWTSWMPSSRPSANGPSATCCPCSPATCSPPGPTPARCSTPRAIAPVSGSRKG